MSSVTRSERTGWFGIRPQRRGTGGAWRGTAAFVLILVAAFAVSVAIDVFQPAALSLPTFEATLETCAVLAALVAAWAFYVNFGRTRRLRDLLLGCGLVILALVDVVSLDGPTMLELRSATAVAGAPMIGGLVAAACFVVAALTPPELAVGTGRRWGAIGVGASVAAAGAAEFASWLLRGGLVPLVADPAKHGISLPTAHPLALLLLVVGVLMSVLAAAGFLTDAERPSSEREAGDAWVAPLFAASVMLIVIGAECLDWFTLPSAQAPAAVAPAAGMWLAAFSFMSLGALRQLALQRRLTAAALAERDRQRLARDLHDGICQDLAFIAAHVARLGADGDDHPVAVAARRALAASRGTLAELSASDAPSTPRALRTVADELAVRFGITVDVRAQDVELRADREAVVRIAREAIVNAAKHGHAQHVLVSLQIEEGRLVLRVQDDGHGLAPAELWREGFGIASMRQRASELGGRLETRPGDDGGTELEVVMP